MRLPLSFQKEANPAMEANTSLYWQNKLKQHRKCKLVCVSLYIPHYGKSPLCKPMHWKTIGSLQFIEHLITSFLLLLLPELAAKRLLTEPRPEQRI